MPDPKQAQGPSAAPPLTAINKSLREQIINQSISEASPGMMGDAWVVLMPLFVFVKNHKSGYLV